MNLQCFDLNLLRVVEAVLSEGSASRAAHRLRLSQPAVSQALRRARDAFGDPLLVRHGNRLLPTPRGTALRLELQAMLRRIEALLAPAEFDPSTSSREFTLASSDLGQVLVLPRLIARVAREAPLSRLKVVPPPGRMDPEQAPDLLIMGAPPPDGAFRWRVLFEDRFVLLARRDHPAMLGPLSTDSFVRLPQVLVSPRAEGFEGPVDTALQKVGLRRHVAVMLTNFMTLPMVLVDSDLVAAVPQRFAELPFVQSLCASRPLPIEAPSFTMKLVWHVARGSDPALAWLIDRFSA
jgi:DNA-binding transcriptional LysR family regulator